ncbi:MAG: hypothetical protein IKS32_10365 [Solobacterium sp.]|nr:hypothetical protein [Solobacterium sp.]
MEENKVEAVNDELTAQDVKKENANLTEQDISSVAGGAYYPDGEKGGLVMDAEGKRYIEKMERTLRKGAAEGMKRLGELNSVASTLHIEGEDNGAGNCAALVKDAKDKI